MNKPIEGAIKAEYHQIRNGDGSVYFIALLTREGDPAQIVQAAGRGVDTRQALHRALETLAYLTQSSIDHARLIVADEDVLDRLLLTAVNDPMPPVKVSTDGVEIHVTLTEPGQYMMTVGKGNLYIMRVGGLE